MPTVHTTAYKIHGWDLKEELTEKEHLTRLSFRPMPNCVGFSLFAKRTENGTNHFSVVENTIYKPQTNWRSWWADWNDRRDLGKYLRHRWMMN